MGKYFDVGEYVMDSRIQGYDIKYGLLSVISLTKTPLIRQISQLLFCLESCFIDNKTETQSGADSSLRW